MIKISNRVQKLRTSPFVMMAALASKCEGLVKLNNGSPGHGVIPEVQKAISSLNTQKISIYPTPHYGSLTARNNAVVYFQERYGLGFDVDQEINLTTGFTHLFHCLCSTIINPGDEVLLLAPYFPQYEQPIELAGGKVISLPTYSTNHWKPEIPVLQKAFEKHPEAKLIIFNYPNNPTGGTLSFSDWNEIIDFLMEEIVRRNSSGASFPLVLLDDAYVPQFHHGSFSKHPTFGRALHHRIAQSNDAEKKILNQLLTCCLFACTLSKEGMGGTLLGLAASKNQKLMNAMRIPQKASVITSNCSGEMALSVIVKPDPDKTIKWAGKMYSDRLNQLASGLNDIFERHKICKTEMNKPARFVPNAGMYLYVDFSALKGKVITNEFLEKLRSLAGNHLNVEELFFDNQFCINTEIALWLLLEAKVSAIPIGNPDACYLRFSVGMAQALALDNQQYTDRKQTENNGKLLIQRALHQIDIAMDNLLN